jgi:hypothetical protein
MKGSTNRRLRRLHQTIGLFFAPALLLFSLSGALQTFRFQEAKGYGGPPPSWLVWMASVHKDQALPRPPRKEAEAARPPAPPSQAQKPPPGRGRRQALMIFVGLFGIALFISTLLGISIALAAATSRRRSLLILAAGAAVPLLLLYF